MAKLGQIRPRHREGVFIVIATSSCDEAIHSSLLPWIASLPLAMTVSWLFEN